VAFGLSGAIVRLSLKFVDHFQEHLYGCPTFTQRSRQCVIRLLVVRGPCGVLLEAVSGRSAAGLDVLLSLWVHLSISFGFQMLNWWKLLEKLDVKVDIVFLMAHIYTPPSWCCIQTSTPSTKNCDKGRDLTFT
jgi:hypothetical protein